MKKRFIGSNRTGNSSLRQAGVARQRRTISAAIPSTFMLVLLALWVSELPAQQLVISLDAVGPNGNEQAALQQLDAACDQIATPVNAAETDLVGICDQLAQLDVNDPEDAGTISAILGAVSPEEAFSVNDSLIYESDFQTLNLQSRLAAHRTLRNARLQALRQFEQPDSKTDEGDETQSGSGAGESALVPKFGLFFNGDLNNSEHDGMVLQQDADSGGGNLTVGGDFRLKNDSVLGAAIGFLVSDTDFSNVPGETNTESVNLSAFGTWNLLDSGFIDAILDFGTSSYELSRGIGTRVGVSGVERGSVLALGETDASRVSVSLSGGKYFNFQEWQVTAALRITRTAATIDGYTETPSNTSNPGFSAATTIDEQSVDSTNLSIGVDVSRAVSTPNAVVVPFARLEIQNESEENKGGLTSTLAAASVGAGYSGTNRDTSFATLGLGVTAVLRNGVNGYAMLDTFVGHDIVTRTNIRIGLRLEL